MIFGLFKPASKRAAEAVQTHVNALKGLDDHGLGSLALYCAYTRLEALSRIYPEVPSDEYANWVALYYRPLNVELPFVDAAISGIEQSLWKFERQQRQLSHNPFAQGIVGLMAAAVQTWRNTWLGCQYGEVRYLSQEMWKLVSLGFPLVEEVAVSLVRDPQFKASPRDIEMFEYIRRDNADGPDYAKIPEGFGSRRLPL